MAKYIKNFLDKDYSDYAVYRVFQRLPHILDSLGQTQRKILYTLEKFPEAKKHKTAEVYSHVYTETQYLHGDMSIYNVVENLARESSNNVNLLTPEGSFGSRTNRSAAAPRYTSTRFSKAARLLFPKEDQPILKKQEFEGHEIEPQFLLPILPPTLLNGYNAIAVGFASKYLPRHPNELIDSMIEALRYHRDNFGKPKFNWAEYKMKEISPAFPFFNGLIVKDMDHDDPSAWFIIGKLQKSKKRNVIEITDVPYDATRESMIKKLKKLVDKGVIKDFSEECRKNQFYFEVKLPPDLYKKNEDEIITKLGLVDKFIENFTFLDPITGREDTIIKFETAEDYLKDFIWLRLQFYDLRKKYQLDKLQEEISILHQRIRFIEMVNNEEIVITRRKKIDLEKELENLGFLKVDENFDYLLGMRIQALTQENVEKFKRYIEEKENEYQKLKDTKIEDIHIHELKIFKKHIQDELNKKDLL
jgi:DNA topoisomerase-2